MPKGLPKSMAKATENGTIAAATATKRGTVKRGVHVPNVSNPPTQAEVNALLTSLRNAGIIASS